MTVQSTRTALTALGQHAFAIRTAIGIALAALSAVLLALSMPPYGLWPLALVGLVPAIVAQHRVVPRQLSSLAAAIAIGGLVGLYIMKALLQLGNAPWYMRLLPLLFGGIVFLTDLGTRAFHERTAYRWFVLSGALGWVGVEMIRSLIPVLGTWGLVAYAYFKKPALIQPVSIFGIFGLSLVNMLVTFGVGQFALAWFDRRWRLDADLAPVDMLQARTGLVAVGALFAAWVLLSQFLLAPSQQDKYQGASIRVAAIQPDYKSLWTPQERAANTISIARYELTYEQMFERLLAQTRDAARQGAQLVVWPEGALNFDPQHAARTQLLRDLAAESNAYLAIPYGVNGRNEVTLLSPDGRFLGVYG